ncbi:MAG: right-handed parallel beta-helix repeat-containing protein, partial [Methanobacteriota archaeon]
VSVDPAPGPNGTYDQGTSVTLTANPQPNWHFVEWLGDVTGTDNPVTFSLDSNMAVTASFASDFKQFTLNLDVQGMGSVSVDPEPILGTYDTATVVHLNAVPALGWKFDGYSGDLTSTSAMDSVVMDADKNITATFSEINYGSGALEIDSTWDLYDAVMTANNNSSIDTLVLTTPGVYTSMHTEDVAVTAPLTIMAKPGLSEKPVITNSDPEKSNIDIFRVFEDFTLIGVKIDGGHPKSHGMKYAVRLSNYTDGDTVRFGVNQIFENVDFINMYQDKDPNKDGHAFKIDRNVRAGLVKFENCTFNGTGYEAIRISDTEKWATDRPLDTLIVRNCTFTNIDAEGIRYYSDPVDDTPDAPVIIEHCTFDHTATRVMYLKNSGGAIVRDIIISNSIPSGHGRDDDLMDAQGTAVFPSYVSHIDTFNVK